MQPACDCARAPPSPARRHFPGQRDQQVSLCARRRDARSVKALGHRLRAVPELEAHARLAGARPSAPCAFGEGAERWKGRHRANWGDAQHAASAGQLRLQV
eukprot:2381219-Pleurochrysis_carterae.AAC.1